MGTARYGHQEEGELTKSGVIMGTVNYMSPEQAKDPHSVDHRCDIYSLGCTLYYLLTGKPLYEGDVIQTLMSHANAAIPSISAQNPQVPSWIDTILAQMLAKNPESRYSTLLEFRNDLQEFASGEDPEGTRLMEELHKAQTTQSYPVGMDFGTATCNAAWLNTSNVPQTIVDEEGDSATPSTVLVVDAMDTLIGKRAVLRATKEFDSSADEIKRFLGLINYPGTIAGERYPPPVLAALLLGKLASDVQRTVGHCKQVAVAVPGYFGEVVRAAVQHATQIAGIDLIGLVDETVASALSYFEGQNPPEPKKLVVIDLGAGKLDVAAMMCGEGVLEVQSVGGESRLGGNDFDDLLLDLVSDGLLATYGYDPRMDPMHTRQLMQGCRDAKERLSEVDSIAIQVQIPGKTTRVTISREKFEEIATPLLERLKNILSEVLEAAQFEASQVDSVLLCGGSLGMPMIRELVDQCFPEIEKVSLPHDSVARGAAIYAGIRCAMQVGSATPLRVQSVTGRALGMVGTDVKTGNQVNAIVLPKNTHRPVKVRRILKTHQDNQQNMLVQLIEGESANPDECLVVGKCVVENLPHNLPSKSPIGLVFHYDVHGRLSVEGELDETQKRVQVPVTRDNDLENVDLFRWREWLETVMLCSGM
ncbi:MAG: Hsp70 family protein, partial [Planctomycetota bacterium]|nr:Hsp70 family protein [Planctomycetota bacterium]